MSTLCTFFVLLFPIVAETKAWSARCVLIRIYSVRKQVFFCSMHNTKNIKGPEMLSMSKSLIRLCKEAPDSKSSLLAKTFFFILPLLLCSTDIQQCKECCIPCIAYQILSNQIETDTNYNVLKGTQPSHYEGKLFNSCA